jgi:NAD(P)-dependent dehydrogenase (short-subunit alcohol dehydrogenase family)
LQLSICRYLLCESSIKLSLYSYVNIPDKSVLSFLLAYYLIKQNYNRFNLKYKRSVFMIDISQFSLEGKVALITGGSRGIGEATAIAFARAGANVAVNSRKLPDLERVANEVRKFGKEALAVEAHIGRMEMLQPLVDKVIDKFGKIDILVNNAGTNFFMPAIEMTEKGWDAVMNLNLKGLFFLSQSVAKQMAKQGDGRIINISSVDGIKAHVPTGHYSIAKAGVIMATKVMALEWAQYNIRVNCIAPGAIETRLYEALFALLPHEEATKQKETAERSVPLGRAGEPRELANAVLFLASDASSYVTGQTFNVDGGLLL